MWYFIDHDKLCQKNEQFLDFDSKAFPVKIISQATWHRSKIKLRYIKSPWIERNRIPIQQKRILILAMSIRFGVSWTTRCCLGPNFVRVSFPTRQTHHQPSISTATTPMIRAQDHPEAANSYDVPFRETPWSHRVGSSCAPFLLDSKREGFEPEASERFAPQLITGEGDCRQNFWRMQLPLWSNVPISSFRPCMQHQPSFRSTNLWAIALLPQRTPQEATDGR